MRLALLFLLLVVCVSVVEASSKKKKYKNALKSAKKKFKKQTKKLRREGKKYDLIGLMKSKFAQDQLRSVKRWAGDLLKYDLDCSFLNAADYQIRAQEGRCPDRRAHTGSRLDNKFMRVLFNEDEVPDPAIAAKALEERRRKSRMAMILKTKRVLLGVLSFGKIETRTVIATENGGEILCNEGTIVNIKCPYVENSTYQANFYINNIAVDNSLFDWRVKVEGDTLQIFPTVVEDTGLVECYNGANGEQFVGFVNMRVLKTRDAILYGLLNYSIIIVLFLPIIAFAFAVLWKQDFKISEQKSDPLEEFLEKHLNENGNHAKENIARAVFGGNLENVRNTIHQELHTGKTVKGDPVRNNLATIMTILAPRKLPPPKPALS